MNHISWEYDNELYSIVKEFKLPKKSLDHLQYPGSEYFYVDSWKKHIIGSFPDYILSQGKDKLSSKPENIILCFKNSEFLSALVLVILWGNMVRTKNKIYTTKELNTLETILKNIYDSKVKLGDVKGAWLDIRNKLKWTNVIISKYLHFAFRAAEFDNPPVPIDNLIIRYEFLPKINTFIRSTYEYKLSNWFDKNYSWDGYNEYMTIIIALSDKYGVSTTKIENAIFGMYR